MIDWQWSSVNYSILIIFDVKHCAKSKFCANRGRNKIQNPHFEYPLSKLAISCYKIILAIFYR